nr:zinc-dependent metalloprotease [Bacteroidota bacterium]
MIASWAQEPVRIGRVTERIETLKAQGQRFTAVSILERIEPTEEVTALWSGACTKATVLKYNEAASMALLASSPQHIALSIPTANGEMVLEMQRTDIVTDDFILRSSTGDHIEVPIGIHYRGMIQGVAGSIAAISFYEEEVMGIISDASGETILGRFAQASDGLHVWYHEDDLRRTSGAVCSTPDDGERYSDEQLVLSEGERTTRCVELYWEVAYDIVQNKGSVSNATNYVLGLFNQSAILYDNDAIDILLSEVFVWSSASPYNATSSSGRLDQFGDIRTSFNGDLAHLLDLGSYGGIAWLNTLCSSSYYRMAYSGINTTYQNVPTYSWSVEVVTHEQGHNMGSKHTHACAWNGNNTAIDGC